MATYTAVNGDGTTTDYVVTNTSTNADLTVTQNNQVWEVNGDTGNIVVNADITTVLILTGMNRTGPPGSGGTGSPLRLLDGSNATIVLVDDKTNTFTCITTNSGSTSHQAGINVVPTAKLTIKGQAGNTGTLIANAGIYSAGIGNGPNQACGDLSIEGGIINANGHSTATGAGTRNGAGIGSGGGASGVGATNTSTFDIWGNAIVTATTAGNGAGIGCAGSNSNVGGASGTINIFGNAKVTAHSGGAGAGIGGGGTATGVSGGAGGNINIYGNATVSATSLTGIGMGAGTRGSTGVPGMAADLRINGGNIYSSSVETARNNTEYGGDVVEPITFTADQSTQTYEAIGSVSSYPYTATGDSTDKVIMWLPVDNQVVLGIDNADIIGNEVLRMTTTPTDVAPPRFNGFASTDAPQTVTWDGTSSLSVIKFNYFAVAFDGNALMFGTGL